MAAFLHAYQLTLTTASTKYSLRTLITAIESGAPQFVGEIQLQSDKANAASKISVGDTNISTTRYGYQLEPGEGKSYGPGRMNGLDTASLYFMSDTNAVKINVELMEYGN